MKLEKLGNIATIKTGKYDVNHSTPDGEYVFYTCAFGQFKSPTYSFEGPAIILPGNGANVGEVFFYDGKFEAYQRTYVVQNFKAVPIYIYTYFKAKWKNSLRNKQFGSATNYIRLNNLTDFIIPVPPLADQLHVANLLSKAENLISQRKESIRLLDEFLKSTFLEMFGDKSYDKVKLGDILEIQSGQVNPNELPYCEMYHVGGANIESNTGKLINLKYAKDEYLISGKYFFTKDHVLYSKIRPNLNKVAIPDFSGICSADMYPLLPDLKRLNKNYLRFTLMSDDFLSYALKHSDRTNIPKINRNALIGYSISLPSIKLQNQFGHIVEKTEALKTQYQQSLQELENLYGSLSQRAFKGELTLRQEERFLLAAEPDIKYKKKPL